MGSTMCLPWEPAFIVALQSIMNPFLTQVASIITMFGEEMLLVFILGFLYWCCDKQFGVYAGESIVVISALNPMLKNLVLRRRPYMDFSDIKCLKAVDSTADINDVKVQGYSFPSGHSMNSAVVYGSLARYKKTSKVLGVIGIVLPLLVGLSRVLLGVHYPTDVLAGWAIGVLIIFLIPWLKSKFQRRWLFHLMIVLLMLPGFFYCKTNDYYSGLGLMIGFYLAIPFEERFVKFKNINFDEPMAIVWCILRVIGGGAVYLGLNMLLKMPIPESIREAENIVAYLLRTARYGIVAFVAIGVYPILFKLVERKHE